MVANSTARKGKGKGAAGPAVSILETYAPVSNGAIGTIDLSQPYSVEVTVQGVSALLFHRWNNEAVKGKADAAKGSKAKKTDDLESYIYRTEQGEIALPGEYFRMSIVNTAKFRQDPRSPRKSAMDLFKAGVVVTPDLCSLGSKDWDYVDQRRVMVQRNGVTRARPAFKSGWEARFIVTVVLPEYITPEILLEVLNLAGRITGVADFRPTYGRYAVTHWAITE